MHKKNMTNSKDSERKHLKKIHWKSLAAGGMMLASVLSTHLSNGQHTDNQAINGKKDMIELFEKQNNSDNVNYNIDTSEHQKLLEEVIIAVNTFRKQNGLEPLIYEPKLQKIAQQYANYCAKNNWTEGHYDKEGNGLQERTNDNGYYDIARENLYFGGSTPIQVVHDRSEHSQVHRLNMLSSTSKKIAVGVAKMEKGSYIYVLVLFD